MLAAEALRKARATMDCEWGVCELLDEVNAVLAETFEGGYGGQSEHDQAASALLDGFSVDEITAAEEALV